MRVTFFCFAKRKSPKKRRPPVCDPFAVRRGKPASGRLRGAPWNSLCCYAAPLGQPRRVRSRSMGASTPMPPHNRTARRRSQQGVDSRTTEQPDGPRAIAALGLACAARGACAREMGPSAAQRSDGPCGCPHPGFPSGCAEERRGQRIRARDCLSAVKRSEFERDPAGREHRRLPAAKRRDAACRVAFSLVTFFWRSKRKPLRRRAHTPASAFNPSTPLNLQTGAGTLRPNGQRKSNTIKIIAISA